MGSVIGLNYQSVEFLFKIYSVEDQKQMLEDLMIIEAGALNVIHEKERG